MIWKKCFNQVYASEGMSEFDDYIQIVPLVKLQKRSTTDRLFEAIDNSYHVVQAHSGDSDLVLPQGWLFGDRDHFNLTQKKIAIPTPNRRTHQWNLQDRVRSSSVFKTQRAWLRIAPRPESLVSMCEEVCELARHGSLQLRRLLSNITLCRHPMNSS